MAASSERQAKLFAVTQEHLQYYRTGDTAHFPSRKELARMAGFSDPSHVGLLLKEFGLPKLFQEAKKERLTLTFPPSRQFAWIMGYFSEHGSPHKNSIYVTDETPETRAKYQNFALYVFGKKPETSKNARTNRGLSTVFIHDQEITARIGDVSSKSYGETLNKRYRWLVDTPQYAWGFIEGILDAKAHVTSERINIHIRSKASAEFIHKSMIMAGIKGATIHFDPANNYWTVNISRDSDLVLVAKKTTMATPKKEEQLAAIRPCTHHWKIEENRTITSHGSCINCGEEKTFNNIGDVEIFNATIRY